MFVFFGIIFLIVYVFLEERRGSFRGIFLRNILVKIFDEKL